MTNFTFRCWHTNVDSFNNDLSGNINNLSSSTNDDAFAADTLPPEGVDFARNVNNSNYLKVLSLNIQSVLTKWEAF